MTEDRRRTQWEKYFMLLNYMRRVAHESNAPILKYFAKLARSSETKHLPLGWPQVDNISCHYNLKESICAILCQYSTKS